MGVMACRRGRAWWSNAKRAGSQVQRQKVSSIPTTQLARESLVYTAPDGKDSLNYLDLSHGAFFEGHQRIVERRLFEHEGDTKIQEKYHWLLEYQADMEKRVFSLGLASL